jgi:hypothetical protein
MSWRDLKPLDDWYELERPGISELATGYVSFQAEGGALVSVSGGNQVMLTFTDELSREWFAEWLRSKRGWQAFTDWVDERR